MPERGPLISLLHPRFNVLNVAPGCFRLLLVHPLSARAALVTQVRGPWLDQHRALIALLDLGQVHLEPPAVVNVFFVTLLVGPQQLVRHPVRNAFYVQPAPRLSQLGPLHSFNVLLVTPVHGQLLGPQVAIVA